MKLPSLPVRGSGGKLFGDRDPFRIGIAAFVGLGLLGALIVVISTVSFGTRSYTAQLPHTAGLRVGESVQVAGVDSGEVTGIELAGDKVLVEFTVDRSIRLGRDTEAAVKVSTLLGTHYLDIDPQGAGRAGARIRALADAGAAVILADHHVAEALRLCDRAALLLAGEVVLVAPPAEFCRDPRVQQHYTVVPLGEEDG